MFVTVQWLVLLSSVEYSCVPQYSGLFYFQQLNIHVCHSTVACFTFISEYSRSSQYSGVFYFHQLNICVCHSTVACFTFIS